MPSLPSRHLRTLALACSLTSLLTAPACVSAQIATIGAVESRSFSLDATAVRVPISQSFNAVSSPFITVHFGRFQLASGDSVVVRSPDGATRFEYTGLGRGALGDKGGFYSSRIPGNTAMVEFIPSSASSSSAGSSPTAYGFTVDQITRATSGFNVATTCGTDDTVPAKCFATAANVTESTLYQKSQAVARLLINGTTSCTGWLVGDQGHLLSNFHCLGEPGQAAVTDYEFNAESGSCTDQCRIKGGCAGTIVATTATLVAADEALDYALVKLDTSVDLSAFGFLKLRVLGATLAERIVIPQHPNGYAKRLAALEDDGSVTTITGVDASSACGDHRVLYTADTLGGSSGSPVIAASDSHVVALHSCGVLSEPCVNSATDIRGIIYDLQSKNVLPSNALDDPAASIPIGPWIPGVTAPPTPAPTPVPTQSVCLIFSSSQVACLNTVPGRCLWVNGKCAPNPAFGGGAATTAPPTATPDPPVTTTPAPVTPEPTTAKPIRTPKPKPTGTTKPAPTRPPTPAPTTAKPPSFTVCSWLWFKSTCDLWSSRCAWRHGACMAL